MTVTPPTCLSHSPTDASLATGGSPFAKAWILAGVAKGARDPTTARRMADLSSIVAGRPGVYEPILTAKPETTPKRIIAQRRYLRRRTGCPSVVFRPSRFFPIERRGDRKTALITERRAQRVLSGRLFRSTPLVDEARSAGETRGKTPGHPGNVRFQPPRALCPTGRTRETPEFPTTPGADRCSGSTGAAGCAFPFVHGTKFRRKQGALWAEGWVDPVEWQSQATLG